VEEQRGIRCRMGDWPDMVERHLERERTRVGHQPVGRFVPDHATPGRGYPDRPAIVAAKSQINLPRSYEGSAAARGPTRHIAGSARVLYGTGIACVATAGEAQVLAHGFADDLAALVEDPRYHCRVGVGYVALQHGRSVHHRDARDAYDVLDRDSFPG